MPEFNIENVTPKQAAAWLALNLNNRTIRKNKVAQFASDMARGHWTLTNDAVCFDTTGVLLNGQHRLHAVVLADVPVAMLIGHGLPAATLHNMDRGTGRTFSDHLGWDGEPRRTLLASTLRLLVVINERKPATTVSDADMRGWLEAHPDVRHSVESSDRVRTRVNFPPTALAAAHWMIAQRNGSALADYFLHQLDTRADEPSGSAIHALANRVERAKRNRERHSNDEYAALLIKGWNYYAQNKHTRTLAIDSKVIAFPRVAKWARKTIPTPR